MSWSYQSCCGEQRYLRRKSYLRIFKRCTDATPSSSVTHDGSMTSNAWAMRWQSSRGSEPIGAIGESWPPAELPSWRWFSSFYFTAVKDPSRRRYRLVSGLLYLEEIRRG